MAIREEKILLSADRYGRIAIVRRPDGLLCLYAHWHWTPDAQHAFGVEPIEDRRWTGDQNLDLYADARPLSGLYGTVADAEAEARRLLRLDHPDGTTKTILLDASSWQTPDDFFSALLPRLGAPDWHGRNLNALDDSLLGGINQVEPPFTVIVEGAEDLSPEMASFLAEVSEVFDEARRQYEADVKFTLI